MGWGDTASSLFSESPPPAHKPPTAGLWLDHLLSPTSPPLRPQQGCAQVSTSTGVGVEVCRGESGMQRPKGES